MTTTDHEAKMRAALRWAIDTTCLILPVAARNAAVWKWNADDASLTYETISERLDFQVRMTAGRKRISEAELTWEDDEGKVTWVTDIPSGQTVV